MLSEKEKLEKFFMDEIKLCQNDNRDRTEMIDRYEKSIASWRKEIDRSNERIEMLQKLLLTLSED